MKNILILSTSDVNGAYEATFKVALILKEMGHIVKILVKDKTKQELFIIEYPKRIRNILKNDINLILKKFRKNTLQVNSDYGFFSVNETKSNIDPKKIIDVIGFTPDYIFVGMTIDFMNTTDIYNLQQLSNARVYNITVDMNHFTGGCHFAWDCRGYITGCGDDCPAILSKSHKNLAKINFKKKLENAQKGNFQILAGSGWTLKQSKESKIYKNQKKIENINSLIDTQIFNNKNRKIATQVFSLDNNKFYILSGAQNSQDKRKGFEFLIKSLSLLEKELNEEQKKKIEILVVSRQTSEGFNKIGFNKRKIDYINDYRLLSLLYQATNLYVNTSIEDSGPMMVSEALACGTPVVGFDMGIVNNMIVNGYNGYKAKLKDSDDLALEIKKIFELTPKQYNEYSNNSVKQVEQFSSFEYAKQIFERILT